MKKFALIMCIALLLSTFAPLSAMAADNADSKMLVHYDFSTGDATHANNTAVVGKDNLWNPDTVKKENGLAIVYGDTNGHFNGGFASDSEVKKLKEATYFLSFIPAGHDEKFAWARVMVVKNMFEVYIENDIIYARTLIGDKADNGGKNQLIVDADGKKGYALNMGKRTYLAISQKFADGNLITDFCISQDGENYTVYSTSYARATAFENSPGLAFGKPVRSNNVPNAAPVHPYTFSYDDFRIYNKAFSADQVKNIKTAPANVVYQTADAADKYSIRFSAAVDSLDYADVGFKIVAKYNGGEKVFNYSGDKVYSGLMAGGKKITAEALGGKYLVLFTINNVPDSLGEVTFSVTPVCTTRSGEVVNGDTVNVVYNGSTGK